MKNLMTFFLFITFALFPAAAQTPAKGKILVIAEIGGQHEKFTLEALKHVNAFAEKADMKVSQIHNASEIDDRFLSQFALIIQLDYPPYGWGRTAEQAFEKYVDEGRGGWIGFHHASLLGEFDGHGMWHWFSSFLGGIRFDNYIAGLTKGTVNVEAAGHPVMKGVAK